MKSTLMYVTHLGIEQAEMGTELAKFAMMKSFFEINFRGLFMFCFPVSYLILKLL